MSDENTPPTVPQPLTGANGGHRFTQADRSKGGKLGFAKRKERHGQNASITRELYDAAVEAYLKGDRTIASVQRAIHVAKATAKKLVDRGYPDRNWASLRERAILWDKQKTEAESKAHAQHTLALLDQKERARQERHAILRVAKAGFSRLIQSWQAETSLATSHPKAKKPDGLSMNALALTGERLMNAMTRFSEMEERDLELMTQQPEEEKNPQGIASLAGLTAESVGLTPSDLDFILDNGGRLPAHVDRERLLGRVVQGK